MNTADAAASTAGAYTYIRPYTYIILYYTCTVGYLLAKGWAVRGSNPGGGEIFRTRPDGPGAHPASYTMDTESLPVLKRPWRGIDHPPPNQRRG